MSRLPYPTKFNDIIKCQIMESKSNHYHLKNDKNNWNLINQIIKHYSVSHKKEGCYISDCIGSTYDIEDIYNNMKALMLVFNTDYHEQKNNKKRRTEPLNSGSIGNGDDGDGTVGGNCDGEGDGEGVGDGDGDGDGKDIFKAYHELPDFIFRKKHAQHFLQNFKLPTDSNNSMWPVTIYLFSGNDVYYADGYNGKQCGDFIFYKSVNNQPIVFTNFINQLC